MKYNIFVDEERIIANSKNISVGIRPKIKTMSNTDIYDVSVIYTFLPEVLQKKTFFL